MNEKPYHPSDWKTSPTVSTKPSEDYNMDWPKVPETVHKASDIIDGKFLEDYFYNS